MPLNDQDININFCSILGLFFSKNNDQHSALSMFIGEFNVKCAKCWATDKNNAVGLELNNITKTGYSQMNHKQTHFINELPSFIDLIFISSTSFAKNCDFSVNFNVCEVSMYLSLGCLGLQMQILRLFEKLFQCQSKCK